CQDNATAHGLRAVAQRRKHSVESPQSGARGAKNYTQSGHIRSACFYAFAVGLGRYVFRAVFGVFAPCAVDCGLSTECGRCCATAQLRHAVVRTWQTPEVQKRLSFAYFSLPLQRKVGAAPHRGDARSTNKKSRMPPKRKK
ncbi:hypothetical protein, partial [Paraburkholderia sabiae]|uniref:hypothetical protein n=1 Tax=Paraburkholderia sabiae TaxID=273251 RepID=UPI003F4970C9